MSSRDRRRGDVEHKRARDNYVEARHSHERHRDDVQSASVKEQRHGERIEKEIRGARGRSGELDSEKHVSARLGSRSEAGPSAADTRVGHRRPVEQPGAAASGAATASEQRDVRQSEVAQIADQIVESARTGFDAEGRKLLEMTLEIPGRGRLEIKLRKHGSKMQVELAADSPAFGRLLRRNRKDIKRHTRERGVQLSSVRVSR